jgi:hypothetical protein
LYHSYLQGCKFLHFHRVMQHAIKPEQHHTHEPYNKKFLNLSESFFLFLILLSITVTHSIHSHLSIPE